MRKNKFVLGAVIAFSVISFASVCVASSNLRCGNDFMGKVSENTPDPCSTLSPSFKDPCHRYYYSYSSIYYSCKKSHQECVTDAECQLQN